MAVDAKDQITHGQISDECRSMPWNPPSDWASREERQLKAIETAALLHDMGKLAIPEHILHKGPAS